MATNLPLVLVCLALRGAVGNAGDESPNKTCLSGVSLQLPLVALSGVNTTVNIRVPKVVNGTVLTNLTFSLHHDKEILQYGNLTTGQENKVKLKIFGMGHKRIDLWVEDVCEEGSSKELFITYPLLSILPPILTIFLAIAMKQVLLALAAGIYLGCFFIYEYNPLTAFLRMHNKYITNAVGNHDNAAILVSTVLLGGLIAVVQRSGGAHGLANNLRRLATTRRRSLLVGFACCCLIFFDDYSCILITGNTLRSVMSSAGVSKNKFGSIIHSIGPSLPSMIPFSGWIGFETGTVHQTFTNGEVGAYTFAVKTIPYRFFPLLMFIFPLLTAVLGVEFGPMLTIERKACSAHSRSHRTNKTRPFSNDTSESSVSHLSVSIQEPDEERRNTAENEGVASVSSGLDPKPGIPHRGINAGLPFSLVAVLSFVGTVLNGRAALLNMDPNTRPPVTFSNFFEHCDAIAALMWATALSTWIALISYLAQRLLSVREFMEAWVLGVKEIMDPTLILILAWALGQIVKDLHASEWVSTAIGGSFKVELIPVMAAILACLLSYATGTAFGTMAILFPLVVPIVATHTGDPNGRLTVQTGGAIFGGAVFGNVVAPIADNTILTTLATPIELTTHLKSQTPYVLLVVLTSTVLGHLMVGFGLYPNYVALIISILFLIIVLYLFGRSPLDSHTSHPPIYRLASAISRRFKTRDEVSRRHEFSSDKLLSHQEKDHLLDT